MPHLSGGGISAFFRKTRILTLMFSDVKEILSISISAHQSEKQSSCVQKKSKNEIGNFLTI